MRMICVLTQAGSDSSDGIDVEDEEEAEAEDEEEEDQPPSKKAKVPPAFHVNCNTSFHRLWSVSLQHAAKDLVDRPLTQRNSRVHAALGHVFGCC